MSTQLDDYNVYMCTLGLFPGLFHVFQCYARNIYIIVGKAGQFHGMMMMYEHSFGCSLKGTERPGNETNMYLAGTLYLADTLYLSQMLYIVK